MRMQRILLESCFYLLVILMAPATMADSLNAKADAAAMLLISDHLHDVKLGAKIVHNENLMEREVLDVVAERLAVYFSSGHQLDDQTDTVSWLAKALGNSGDPRYRGLLERVKEDAKSSFSRRRYGKVVDYVDDALRSLREEQVDAFQPIHQSTESLRSAVTALRAAPGVTDELAVSEGTSLEDVYTRLGMPEQVGQYLNRRYVPLAGRVNFQSLELRYGQNAIRFNHDEGYWKVVEVVKIQKTGTLEDQLSSDDPAVFRNASIYMHRNQLYTESLLDLAATNALRHLKVSEDLEVDAASWLCNVMGFSRNPRYRMVLETIVREADSDKLKKYAKKALGNLEDREAEQFGGKI